MNQIDISVVVPIYNVEAYLRECLDSLLAQTLTTIEVLLVNDGTKDNSGEIAQEYVAKYPERFRYFEKENGGLSDARNYAFPYVRGKYVAYVDSDDYVAANMYEKLWEKAVETNADIIECELDKVYSNRTERVYLPKEYRDVPDYMLHSRVCAWNKLYRVEWLKEIQTEFPKGLLYEDVCFFYKITPYLTKMPVTVHEALYFYRQREGSILSNSTERILELHDIFQEIFTFYEERNLLKEYEAVAEYKYVKTLFFSFMLRMLRMKDKKIRNYVIDTSWERINQNRQNWKKNHFLKKLSMRNVYLRMMSKPLLTVEKVLIH